MGKIIYFIGFLKEVVITSNGGCRREEKSRKHWSLFTMLLTSVTKIFSFFLLDQIKSNCMY